MAAVIPLGARAEAYSPTADSLAPYEGGVSRRAASMGGVSAASGMTSVSEGCFTAATGASTTQSAVVRHTQRQMQNLRLEVELRDQRIVELEGAFGAAQSDAATREAALRVELQKQSTDADAVRARQAELEAQLQAQARRMDEMLQSHSTMMAALQSVSVRCQTLQDTLETARARERQGLEQAERSFRRVQIENDEANAFDALLDAELTARHAVVRLLKSRSTAASAGAAVVVDVASPARACTAPTLLARAPAATESSLCAMM